MLGGMGHGTSRRSKGIQFQPGDSRGFNRPQEPKVLGVLGVLVPVMIYMYYVYIEAWCLGYAVNFMAGNLDFQSGDEASAFFGSFVGISDNGAAFGFGIKQVGFFLVAVFILNFFLIYRGLPGESNSSANTRCPPS